eukprot:95699-Hanusia_phi.AAC.1
MTRTSGSLVTDNPAGIRPPPGIGSGRARATVTVKFSPTRRSPIGGFPRTLRGPMRLVVARS